MLAETVSIVGASGDTIEAYLARPLARRTVRWRGGHPPPARLRRGDQGDHAPLRGDGLQRHLPQPATAATRQARRPTTPRRRCARQAACPMSGSSATSMAPRATCAALPSANGRVGVIGYCSGGRQSFLAACSLPLQAAVDCYGAFVVATPPSESPLRVSPLAHLAAQPVVPAARPVRRQRQEPVARRGRRARPRSSPRPARSTSSTSSTTPATASSPSTAPCTCRRLPTRGWELISAFFAKHLSTR